MSQIVSLVTGATGFIGGNLCKRLVDEGQEVHVLVRPDTRDQWENDGFIPKHCNLHYGDIRDPEDMEQLVRSVQPSIIYHLSSYGQNSKHHNDMIAIDTNVLGTRNLLDAVVTHMPSKPMIVNTGSFTEYGAISGVTWEFDALRPQSYYSFAKSAQHLLCQMYSFKHEIPIITLRLFHVYGPGDSPNRLIPCLISKGVEGKLPPLVQPNASRDYVYVDDVVDAYVRAGNHEVWPLDNHYQVFNICTGVHKTLEEVVKYTSEVLGVKEKPQWGSMTDCQYDNLKWSGAYHNAQTKLGWVPTIRFEDGFLKILDSSGVNYGT